jgi:hypothetical protein
VIPLSLGALGNAYYAATNPVDVLFGQAGLPGGNDTSVTSWLL